MTHVPSLCKVSYTSVLCILAACSDSDRLVRDSDIAFKEELIYYALCVTGIATVLNYIVPWDCCSYEVEYTHFRVVLLHLY